MEMKSYLFHGLNHNIIDEEDTLRDIFKSGYILTRKSLQKYLPQRKYREFEMLHSANWNGMDAISIAAHPDNYELVEERNLKIDNFDNAYDDFILGTTALVLDSALLKEFRTKEDSIKMNYELQIIGDIPIHYIKAIALYQSSQSFKTEDLFYLKYVLHELRNGLKGREFCKHYSDTWYLRDYFDTYGDKVYDFPKKFQYIKKLRELIGEYQLNIPVVDIEYGYELSDVNVNEKRLIKLKKQYDEYKRFKGYK